MSKKPKLEQKKLIRQIEQKRINKIILSVVVIGVCILLIFLFLILEGISISSSEGKTEEIAYGEVIPVYEPEPIDQDISYGDTISVAMASWAQFGVLMMIAVGIGVFLSFFKVFRRFR